MTRSQYFSGNLQLTFRKGNNQVLFSLLCGHFLICNESDNFQNQLQTHIVRTKFCCLYLLYSSRDESNNNFFCLSSQGQKIQCSHKQNAELLMKKTDTEENFPSVLKSYMVWKG